MQNTLKFYTTGIMTYGKMCVIVRSRKKVDDVRKGNSDDESS